MHKNNFDFLRLIFSLSVIVTHAYALSKAPFPDLLGQISGQIEFSYIGVSGFFIISGYLIFQSVSRSKGFVDYYWKRIIRLFPALFVVLLLTTIMGAFVYNGKINSYFINHSTWTYLPRNLSLFFLQYEIDGIFEQNPYPSAINGSLWTIAYEFTGYIILSALLLLKNKGKKYGILFAWLFFLILRLFFYERFTQINFILSGKQFINLTTLFLSGAVLAAFNFEKIRNSNWILFLSLAFLIISLFTKAFDFTHFFTLPVVVILFGSKSTKYINSIGAKIGDMSYGIYIYGFPVAQTLMYFYLFNHIELMIYSTFITVVLGYLSWHLIEKRALKLKKVF